MAARRTEAGRVARYRIVAAEAHSWSSLLLEDERGGHVLYVVGAKSPTKVPSRAVSELLARRAYRPWHGDRSWATLDQLPILSQPGELSFDAPVSPVTGPELIHDDAQPA